MSASEEPSALKRLSAAVLAAGLLLAGCGSDDGPEAAAPDSTTTTTPGVTTTTAEPLPPGGRRPTPQDPLRVLMAGDSLMADVSLALASTLQDGGSGVARLVEAPSIPRDEATRALWRQQLADYDPEVIVIMIGVWEGMAEDALNAATGQPLGSPQWESAYRQNNLDPYLRLLTSQGAKVVWIGMPPSREPRRELEWSSMNRAVRHLAATSEDLTWIPGDEILANPDGSWTDVLPGPQGNPQRVRRLDTTHLCAEGIEGFIGPEGQGLSRRDLTYFPSPALTRIDQSQLLNDFHLGGEQTEAAEDLLGGLADRDIDTAVVVLPVTQDYIDAHPGGQAAFDEFLALAERIADDTGAEFVDLHDFVQDDELFADTHHLNGEGATQLSRALPDLLGPDFATGDRCD